jgi:hypothetical protein
LIDVQLLHNPAKHKRSCSILQGEPQQALNSQLLIQKLNTSICPLQ